MSLAFKNGIILINTVRHKAGDTHLRKENNSLSLADNMTVI